MAITRATNLAGLGTVFDALTDGGGLSISGISTFSDLNITRANVTGVTTATQLNVGTGGTVITTTATGLVGIGLSNPQSDLHIGNASGNHNIIMHTANNGNARLRFREGGSVESGYNEYSIGMIGNANALTMEAQGRGEVFRIDTDGNVGIGTSTVGAGAKLHVGGGNIKVDNGYGIDFSSTSDYSGVESEVLDDYEEGVWTPTVTGATATINRAYYIKIGRSVTVMFSAALSSRTATAFSATLPFVSDTTTDTGNFFGVECHGGIMINSIDTLPSNGVFATPYAWNSKVYVYWTLATGGWVQSLGTNLGSNVQFTVTYVAAS